MSLKVLVFLSVFAYIYCGPIALEHGEGDRAARDAAEEVPPLEGMDYLMRFGYMKRPTSREPTTPHAQELALKKFQNMANIPESGVFDAATREMMDSPRCGNNDHDENENEDAPTRRKRYALQGGKWDHKDLTYRINNYTPELSRQEVDLTIAQAFKYWSDKTPLTFTKKTFGTVDIEIKFAYGDHGDGYPFDAQWGTLAHAFFPMGTSNPISGDAHFDEAEVWTLNSPSGANLLGVAVHEFGHSLGLLHSNVKDAIMWPFAKDYTPDLKLGYDDIIGIQTLYGGKPWTPDTTPSTRPTTPSTTTSSGRIDPHYCSMSIDTATFAVDDQTYVFKGDKIYRLGRHAGLESGFPLPIQTVFPEAPNDIDAAMTYKGYYAIAKTYLFKGDSYWRYTASDPGTHGTVRIVLDSGYPKKIKDGWGLDVDKVDSAFVWADGEEKGSPYFVKGDQYWRHTGTVRGPYRGYPRNLSTQIAFNKIPLSSYDAVFKWVNGKTYFFKGSQYYRLSYQKSTGEYHVTGPRDTGYYWFGCISENIME